MFWTSCQFKTAFFYIVPCQGCSSYADSIASSSADDTNWIQAVERPNGNWGCRQHQGVSVPINICLNAHVEFGDI